MQEDGGDSHADPAPTQHQHLRTLPPFPEISADYNPRCRHGDACPHTEDPGVADEELVREGGEGEEEAAEADDQPAHHCQQAGTLTASYGNHRGTHEETDGVPQAGYPHWKQRNRQRGVQWTLFPTVPKTAFQCLVSSNIGNFPFRTIYNTQILVLLCTDTK